jgi:hypothetical protein
MDSVYGRSVGSSAPSSAIRVVQDGCNLSQIDGKSLRAISVDINNRMKFLTH